MKRKALRAERARRDEEDEALIERLINSRANDNRMTRRFRLTNEECFQTRVTQEWNDQVYQSYIEVKRGQSPGKCEWCGSLALTQLGVTFFCDECNGANYPLDEIRYDNVTQRGFDCYAPTSSYPIGDCNDDEYYKQATALYRVPASLNWAHGRIRPRVRVTNEGKPRRLK